MSDTLNDYLRQVSLGLMLLLAYPLSLSSAELSLYEQMTIGTKVFTPAQEGTYYRIKPD